MKVVELYKIVLDDVSYLWTSGDEPISHLGETYLPAAIGRTEVEQGEEINRANITLTVPRDSELAFYLSNTPDHPASVTLFRLEFAEDSPDLQALVYWKGRIASAKASGSEIQISCESVFTSLRRAGVRARYQRGCRHPLYGRGCKLNRADFAVAVEVTAVSGVDLTVPIAASQVDGWYTGGMIEFDGVFRLIINHVGQVLTLQRPFEALTEAIGEAGWNMAWNQYWNGQPGVNIYPGCAHDRPDCDGKFNNLLNYGGFDWIPTQNPFGGRSIA